MNLIQIKYSTDKPETHFHDKDLGSIIKIGAYVRDQFERKLGWIVVACIILTIMISSAFGYGSTKVESTGDRGEKDPTSEPACRC